MNAANIVFVVAGAIAIVGGLVKTLAVGYRFAKRFEASLSEFGKEVKPNGGSSMRDAVNRIEEAVDRLGRRADTMDERLARVEAHAVIRSPEARTRATDE